jgi:DNA-binding transcriptional regulator LsrR (DeoR family)
MEAYTYSSARQNLSRLLDIAMKQGEVKIKRRDGTSFIIRPEKEKRSKSPLDIKGVQVAGITKEEILTAIKESRKKF